jgi:acylphosphatase
MSTRTVYLRISGLVQGVSYRASAQDEARRLGVSGWVRNLPNGEVEAFAFGSTHQVDDFIAWCHRGPEEARVSGVVVREAEADPSISGFSVRR